MDTPDPTEAVSTVRVNGVSVAVDCAPETALLYLLRNDLGLTGAKFGCGQGLCGACTVLVDGRPVRSCETPVWTVTSRDVTTVEGLAPEGAPTVLAEALGRHQAGQCGFCLPGIFVTASALLRQDPGVDEATVRLALDPHLCRCGSHNRIVAAVLDAAAQSAADHASAGSG